MGGRPVGFDIRMGEGPAWGATQYSQIIDQPVALRIIFNTCNCPASTFIGDQGPSAITVNSISGGSQNQALSYEDNYIQYVYE